MHRPNSQGMPNGLPPNWCGTQAPIQPQKTPSHQLNNGLGSSSQSSRDSSPVARFSQLPPTRGHIPASQLPPSRPGVISPIGHQIGLNPNGISATQVSTITPQSSPKLSNFNTSTPILQTNDISSAVPQKTDATVNQFAPPYSSAANLPQMQHYPLIGQQTNVLTPMPVFSQTLPQTTNLLPVTNLPANMPPMRHFPQSGQTSGKLPPVANFPQPNILQHASSTSALPQTGGNLHQNSGNLFQTGGNLLGVKQNLNQPQIIERPLSSGQLSQTPKSLNEQSQYSQSQGQLGALPAASVTASATDSNQPRSAPTNQFTQQFNNLPPLTSRQNMSSSIFDSNTQSFNNLHQPQAADNRPPNSQTFNNFPPNSGSPKPNMTPPTMTTSGQPSPSGSDSSHPHMPQSFNNLPPTGSDRPPVSQSFSALPPHSSAPKTNMVSAMVTSSDNSRPPISQSFTTLPQNSGAHIAAPMMSKSGQPSPAHSDSGKQSFNNKIPSNFDRPPISQSFNIPPFTGGPKPPMYPITGSNLPPYSAAPRPNLPPPTINQSTDTNRTPQMQSNMPPNAGANMPPIQPTNFNRPPITQHFNLPPKASITPPVMAPGSYPLASENRTQPFLPPTSEANMPPPMTTNLSQPTNADVNRPVMQPYNILPQTAIAPKRQPSPANSDSSKTQAYNNFAVGDVNRIPTQPFNNSGAMAPQMMQGQSSNISSNQNYSNVRLPQPNTTPNLYNPAQPPRGPAPLQIPPPVSQIQPSAVSSIHAKRYPQPQYQNQQPQQVNYQQPNANYQNPAVTQPNALPQPALNQQQYKQPTPTYQQPQQAKYNQINYQQNVTQQMANMNVVNSGFNKAWGAENYDLLNCPNILPEEPVQPPKVHLGQEFLDNANCNSEIFRCTMTKIPESNSLLQKSRLPLGVLIHPFKDLNHLPVIQCTTIVRCRACRTYINPFIFFVDTKRWKCNLCYRVNELPEEFHYDPVSKSYGDPSRRPEIKSSTIEYIAPSEYMLRPPQPAVYLFLLDISRIAVESGYLHTVCEVLSTQLSTLPGDGRTQIGFIAYNSTLHFFSLAEGLSQPHEMIVSEIDDVFLPCPDNLLVNLKEHMELITDLLTQLPTRYQNSYDSGSALGAALQAALKMMSSTGGRVSVFQTSLPMLGPGALTVREDPNQRAGKEAPHLNPATDFYKRLALDCSAHQIAVDLFILNSQYVDVASLSGVSRFSGGCMYHFPLFKASRTAQAESLEKCFRRYLTRKIGFEAVMRIRCTRGLAIHTFHGNFFVRSTDLLSLPNVNPDAGFGMQVSIEESLSDLQSVCFQAALLYTSSKGERRIRVHTLCLPIVTTLPEVLNSADQQCIVGFLAKMAVDRSLQTSLSDARDAFINAAIDILSSYKLSLNMGSSTGGLIAPNSLKLLPLYILALLKFTAFRTGQSTRLDDRVFAMCDMKTLPLAQLLQQIYPDLYPLHRLGEFENYVDSEGVIIPQLPRLQVTSRNIDSHGAYLLDVGQQMIIFVCQNITPNFLTHTLGVPSFNSISDQCYELPKLDVPDNQRLHAFINHLNDEKPYPAALLIMRENSPNRTLMFEHLIEDRLESALSYNEFLQHLKTQVK